MKIGDALTPEYLRSLTLPELVRCYSVLDRAHAELTEFSEQPENVGTPWARTAFDVVATLGNIEAEITSRQVESPLDRIERASLGFAQADVSGPGAAFAAMELVDDEFFHGWAAHKFGYSATPTARTS